MAAKRRADENPADDPPIRIRDLCAQCQPKARAMIDWLVVHVLRHASTCGRSLVGWRA